MASVHLSVTGMTCDHCRGRVEKSLKAVPGVYGVYVDLTDGSADVDFDESKADRDALIEAIKSSGYSAEISG